MLRSLSVQDIADRLLLAAAVSLRSPQVVKKYHAADLILRNGRWGSCTCCPYRDGMIYPEECPETDRYDHSIDSVKDGKFTLDHRDVDRRTVVDLINRLGW